MQNALIHTLIGMIFFLIACSPSNNKPLSVRGISGWTGTSSNNQVPIANAGRDQRVRDFDGSGDASVTLDGTASLDLDGVIVKHDWFIDNLLVGHGQVTSMILSVGNYQVELKVTDEKGSTSTDTMLVFVYPPGSGEGENEPPIAHAGSDQTLIDSNSDGVEIVSLNASLSFDPDGRLVDYTWREGSNELAHGALVQVTLPIGNHTITLEVTDDDGATDGDTVQVNVNPSGGGGGGTGDTEDAQPGEIFFLEIDEQDQVNLPITFTQPFAKGKFPGDVKIHWMEGNQDLPAQVKVMRRHPDGSIFFALFSTKLPSLLAHEKLRIKFMPGTPPSPPSFQVGYSENFDARIYLTGSSGTANLQAGVREILGARPDLCQVTGAFPSDRAYLRINGPLYKECIAFVHARRENGTLDPLINIWFSVKMYSGYPTVQVQTVVEHMNTKPMNESHPDQVYSSARIEVGVNNPVTTWSETNPILLSVGQRFERRVYYGPAMPRPERHDNQNDFVQARIYDRLRNDEIPVPYNSIDSYWNGFSGRVYEPNWDDGNQVREVIGALPRNMGQTGNNAWIGHQPDWVKRAIATHNRRAWDYVFLQEGSYGKYRVRIRQPNGDIGARCGDEWLEQGSHLNSLGAFPKPDYAHQPSVSYVAYAMTGDLYFEEEMLAWTMWSTKDYCKITGPARATAWGLRNLMNPVSILSDNHPRLAYLNTTFDNWLAYLRTKTIDNPNPHPLHLIEDHIYQNLAMSGAGIWVNAARTTPWQNSWVCWALRRAVKLGFDAKDQADWHCGGILSSFATPYDSSQWYTDAYRGQIYKMPFSWTMPYHLAAVVYDELDAQVPGLFGCDETNPPGWNNLGHLYLPTTFGEMHYWTAVNAAHEGYPVPNWCPTLDPINTWTPYNGVNEPEGADPGWMEYAANLSVTAIVEAVWDTTNTHSTGLDQANAERALQDYENYCGGAINGLSTKPMVLE